MITQNLIIVLLFVSYLGLSITVIEWKTIWERGRLVGLGRLLVLNLPILLALNLLLLKRFT